MTDDKEQRGPIIGGSGGNTGGTGGPAHSGRLEGVGAGAAGSGGVDEADLQTVLFWVRSHPSEGEALGGLLALC